MGTFIVMVQSRSNVALPFVQLGKSLYTQYKDIEIYFLARKKIKIITTDYSVANSIASDEILNVKFATFIPSELCEVKGVCPILLEYVEKKIFEFDVPKNMLLYGSVPDYCRITEIKRFSRLDFERIMPYEIDSVLICFSGNILPSHISLNSVS